MSLALLALLLRRVWNLAHLRRCLSWQAAQLARRPGWHEATSRPIHVIVPLYQEQLLAEPAVAFWRARCADDAQLHVLLVTTEKEGDGEGTTAAFVRRALDECATPGVEHLHVLEVHDYRAVQLNAAVETVRSSAAADSAPWIGVYNADSQPCASTFHELRFAIDCAPQVRAYQQLAQYVVPRTRPSSAFMEAFAALQTWWTYTSYFARNARGRSRMRLWARTSPFSTFGHGEFIRLDALDAIGGFPDFAYADGLLLGWLLRFGGDELGLLASPDFAEVPRNPRELVAQHRAWMRGLLNVRAAARRAQRESADGIERNAIVAGHVTIATAWGLRPLLALTVASWGARELRAGSRRDGIATIAGLLLYGAIPQLASAAFRRLPGDDVSELAPAVMRPRQLLGSPVTSLVDGLGFAPAVWDTMASDRPPPKTKR